MYGGLLVLGGNRIPALIFGNAFSGIELSSLATLPISLAIIQSGRTILKSSALNNYVLFSMIVGLTGFVLHFLSHQNTLSTSTMLLGVNLTAATIILAVLATSILTQYNSTKERV